MRPERPSSPSAGVPAATPSSRLGDDDGNGTEADGDIAGARASFRCLRLFPLLLEDDFVLAIICATGAEATPLWNRAFDGGVASSGVAGTDVRSIHSSSRSPPSVDADAVRVKLTARVFPDVFFATGVLPVTRDHRCGRARCQGSSGIIFRVSHSLYLLSDPAREETRSSLAAPSAASEKSSPSESSSSTSSLSPSPS